MAETPTPTTTVSPNYPTPTETKTSNKFDTFTADTAMEQKAFSTGVPLDEQPKSGRPPKESFDPVTQKTVYSFYNPSEESQFILQQLTPKRRDDLLRIIYERGGYGGSKMGNGLGNADISAFANLLYFSNIEGKSWDKSLAVYQKTFPVKGSLLAGSGTRAPKQVTNPDDLKIVFRKAAQDLLGRAVDDKAAEQFVQSFQKQQVEAQTAAQTQPGGVVAQAPDAGVSAEKMIEQKFGGEVRVQQAADLGNIMDQMIKGLAR